MWISYLSLQMYEISVLIGLLYLSQHQSSSSGGPLPLHTQPLNLPSTSNLKLDERQSSGSPPPVAFTRAVVLRKPVARQTVSNVTSVYNLTLINPSTLVNSSQQEISLLVAEAL